MIGIWGKRIRPNRDVCCVLCETYTTNKFELQNLRPCHLGGISVTNTINTFHSYCKLNSANNMFWIVGIDSNLRWAFKQSKQNSSWKLHSPSTGSSLILMSPLLKSGLRSFRSRWSRSLSRLSRFLSERSRSRDLERFRFFSFSRLSLRSLSRLSTSSRERLLLFLRSRERLRLSRSRSLIRGDLERRLNLSGRSRKSGRRSSRSRSKRYLSRSRSLSSRPECLIFTSGPPRRVPPKPPPVIQLEEHLD